MKDWVNSAGIRTCGSRDPRYFGADSRTTQMAGGKGRKNNNNKKKKKRKTLSGKMAALDTLPAAKAVRSHLHKSKGRGGCCYCDGPQICRVLLWEYVRLSGLPRSLDDTEPRTYAFPPHARPFWEFDIAQFCNSEDFHVCSLMFRHWHSIDN